MKHCFHVALALVAFLIHGRTLAGPGDTLTVQAFTFGSPQEAWVVMPSDSLRFEKIYMLYTLKCNSNQNPACGEWDYLTYTYMHQPVTESKAAVGVNYMVNGFSPDSFSYSLQQAFQLQPSWSSFTVITDTVSYASATAGSGLLTSAPPFASSAPVSRSQYLWSAGELSAAGLTAGNITALQFDVLANGSSLHHLNVRMKASALDSLTAGVYENSGFTEAFSGTVDLSTGWNRLLFTKPFYWDGVSNVVVEVTFDNEEPGSDNYVHSDAAAFPNGISVAGNEQSVHFNDANYVSVPAEAFESVDSFITVSFWFRGDDFLQDRTTFEAVNAYGQRLLNVHLPWSDGNIYWDAGATLVGGYDRIYKHADEADYKNNWHHWAFTKNAATGTLKIYRDGILWHSGSGAYRLMNGISTFWIGSALWNSSVSANGFVDEFAVWNKELDAGTISDYLYRDLDAAHPFWNDLLVYYRFNEEDHFSVTDHSGKENHGSIIGAQLPLYEASGLFRNFQQESSRPQVQFEQAVYESYVDSVLVFDTSWIFPTYLVLFEDALNPGLATDTLLVWNPYYQYVFDESGAITDSVYMPADETLYLVKTEYMTDPVPVLKRWELGRYITPYGIGLSLGAGWTWTFDVSDYATLLHDSVFLTAGNWQELLDLKFVFIEGTPPRDPLKIENLWNGYFWYGASWDPIENHLVPKKLLIDDETKNVRLKARVTGHGGGGNLNCAEFCSRTHYWMVNGDTVYDRKVWRDNCDVNPLYPQGGTWIYSRANWCPGAEVETYDLELTPFIIPGDSVELDYDTQEYEWNGGGSAPNYVIETQLVSYGAPNFSLDAGVEDIIRPSSNQIYGRHNPICDQPEIRIRNNGTTTLTSLEISYGLEGNTPSVFQWTGSLEFLDTASVLLGPVFSSSGGNANRFTVAVSKPNGGNDEYEFNNTMSSQFSYPPQYLDSFIVEVITNTASHETSYTLSDDDGNLLVNRDNLADNTTYRDTLFLTPGCYVFRVDDTGGDGLSFWANSDGNGAARFRKLVPGPYLKSFEGDFGAAIYHEFTIGYYLPVEEITPPAEAVLNIYPNPANGEVWADVLLPTGQGGMLQVYNLKGEIILEQLIDDRAGGYSTTINLAGNPPGMYLVRLVGSGFSIARKLVLAPE